MITHGDLKQKNDEVLVSDLKSLITQERCTLIEIINHLREVERRKLYLQKGYPSIFSWMTESLGYSEGAAQRRIQAMRLVQDLPELEGKISSGKLSLCVASQLQSFLRRDDKRRREEKTEKLSKVEKLDLVSRLGGTSARKCEQALAQISPETALPREKTRPITEEISQISFAASRKLIQKFDKLKSLTSHQNPERSYEKLFTHLAAIGLEKLDPVARQKRRECRKNKRNQEDVTTTLGDTDDKASLPHTIRYGAPPTLETKRSIPKPLRDQVWLRDGGQCQYLDKRTGKRCASKHLLELDHQVPFSWGGEHSLKNLRLHCRNHNLYRIQGSELLL